MIEKNIQLEKDRRRDIFSDGGGNALFHVAYDNSRKYLESLDLEELKKVINYYQAHRKLGFWCSKYFPTFMGLAGTNALVDIAEEIKIIPRVI